MRLKIEFIFLMCALKLVKYAYCEQSRCKRGGNFIFDFWHFPSLLFYLHLFCFVLLIKTSFPKGMRSLEWKKQYLNSEERWRKEAKMEKLRENKRGFQSGVGVWWGDCGAQLTFIESWPFIQFPISISDNKSGIFTCLSLT